MDLDPELLFQISNPIALLGWAALIFSPFAPKLADWFAALIIPLMLSLAYTALMMAHWASTQGGYGSLPNVMLLFTNPHIALAGWLHYLAFDLFVGAWAVRTARAEGIPHLFVLPCLLLIFLFGPAGFLTLTILRATYRMRPTPFGETQ